MGRGIRGGIWVYPQRASVINQRSPTEGEKSVWEISDASDGRTRTRTAPAKGELEQQRENQATVGSRGRHDEGLNNGSERESESHGGAGTLACLGKGRAENYVCSSQLLLLQFDHSNDVVTIQL